MYSVLWLASVSVRGGVARLTGVKSRAAVRSPVVDENIRRRNIYGIWISIARRDDVFYAGSQPAQAPRVV